MLAVALLKDSSHLRYCHSACGESQKSTAIPSSFVSHCPFFVEFFWTELVFEQDEVAVDVVTNLAKGEGGIGFDSEL